MPTHQSWHMAETMCHDTEHCQCGLKRFRTQLQRGQSRRVEFDGKETLVVPVVMARSDVVMNGGLIPVEEFLPVSWDGRPVVIDHPTERGANISANDPVVLERRAIGQIFRTRVDGNALKAEAWIDIEKAEEVYPGLIAQLESGVEMNVSTGYFTETEPQEGRKNGRRYSELHRKIRPDHLAFLPNDKGACSWEDGCGVRVNGGAMKFTIEGLSDAAFYTGQQVKALVNTIAESLRSQARGEDHDHRQIRADLLSDDRSPFTPDDEMGLQYLSAGALKALRDQYLKKSRKANAADPDKDKEDDEVKPEDVKAMVDAALGPLVKTVTDLAANVAKIGNGLSDDDRAALARANKIAEDHKAGLVKRITANSSMTEDQLKTMDVATLEVIANGLPAKREISANFAARGIPRANSSEESDKQVREAMSQNVGVVAYINSQKKKEAA